MNKACIQCGRVPDVKRRPSRLSRRFCSPRCYYAWKGARPGKPCRACGKPLSGPTRFSSRACSRACGYLLIKLKRRRKKKCAECGLDFWPPTTLSRAGKFCSKACHVAHQRKHNWVEVPCSRCGQIMRRRKSQRRQRRAFCSKDCQRAFVRGPNSAAWRGGSDPNRGTEWRRLAEEIRKRDEYRCGRCGKTQEENGQKLSVDHIIPWRMFVDDKTAANDPSNLISLCRSCHSKKTGRAEKKMLDGNMTDFDLYRKRLLRPEVRCVDCNKSAFDTPTRG